jgi:hypothetical protein
MSTGRWHVVLILGMALSCVLAGEDPPPVIFKSDPNAGKVAPHEQERLPTRTPEPQALFVEATRTFTTCAAAHLLRMELSRRQVELFLGDGLTEKRIAQNRRSEQLVGALEAGIAEVRYGCVEGDAMLAEQIMDVRQAIMDHQELLRKALAQAPLTTYTAARASQVLNGLRDVLRNRKLNGVPDPCLAADATCEGEIRRRERTLDDVVRDLPQAER